VQFEKYKRGIEKYWGVPADKNLVPKGMETTDNKQKRYRRELQSYGTPKGSVLELLYELAQITQNRQQEAWAKIAEEVGKRKHNNKRLSNKDIQLTIEHFRNNNGAESSGHHSGSEEEQYDPAQDADVFSLGTVWGTQKTLGRSHRKKTIMLRC
jgi:hypothetical protein